MNLKEIKSKIFSQKTNIVKKEHSLDVFAVWRIVVIFSVGLLLIVFVFSFILYRKTVSEEGEMPVAIINEEFSIDESRVDAVLKYYDFKLDKTNNIIRQPLSLTDPSI